jgi:very-short-patch-repair endonuclease
MAHRCELRAGDIGKVRGLRATGLLRTLVDLCCWRSVIEALVVLDMAVGMSLTDVVELSRYANSIAGRAGSQTLRELAALAEPAESPMETRLRWLMLEARLPRPQVQVDLRDDSGAFLGRADLYYPAARLVIEFDGANHRERLVSDDRRQNLLINAGYRMLRFTTADLKGRPEVILAQTWAALASAPNGAVGSIRAQ